MRRKSKSKKKGTPEKEAERKYQNSPTAKRRTKEIDKKIKDSEFKKRVDQFNSQNPSPNLQMIEKFCNEEGIDPQWFKLKDKKNKRIITLPKPLKITYHQKPKPISREKFLKEDIDFDKIMPILIEQRYVEQDSAGNYLPSQDFIDGRLLKGFDIKKNHATIAIGLDDGFKTCFPDFYLKDKSGVNKFMKIESILKQSFRLIPRLEATAPFNDQDFKDMEPFFTLAGIHDLGSQPERRGRPTDLNINKKEKGIYNLYKRILKDDPYALQRTIYDEISRILSTNEWKRIWKKSPSVKTIERVILKFKKMFNSKKSSK